MQIQTEMMSSSILLNNHVPADPDSSDDLDHFVKKHPQGALQQLKLLYPEPSLQRANYLRKLVELPPPVCDDALDLLADEYNALSYPPTAANEELANKCIHYNRKYLKKYPDCMIKHSVTAWRICDKVLIRNVGYSLAVLKYNGRLEGLRLTGVAVKDRRRLAHHFLELVRLKIFGPSPLAILRVLLACEWDAAELEEFKRQASTRLSALDAEKELDGAQAIATARTILSSPSCESPYIMQPEATHPSSKLQNAAREHGTYFR